MLWAGQVRIRVTRLHCSIWGYGADNGWVAMLKYSRFTPDIHRLIPPQCLMLHSCTQLLQHQTSEIIRTKSKTRHLMICRCGGAASITTAFLRRWDTETALDQPLNEQWKMILSYFPEPFSNTHSLEKQNSLRCEVLFSDKNELMLKTRENIYAWFHRLSHSSIMRFKCASEKTFLVCISRQNKGTGLKLRFISYLFYP